MKTSAKNVVSTSAAPAQTARSARAQMTDTQMCRLHGRADGGPTEAGGGLLRRADLDASTQPRKLGEFTIPGVGKLVKAQRAARIGRNPAIGEAIKIKAKAIVKFRLAKAAKDAVVPPKPQW